MMADSSPASRRLDLDAEADASGTYALPTCPRCSKPVSRPGEHYPGDTLLGDYTCDEHPERAS